MDQDTVRHLPNFRQVSPIDFGNRLADYAYLNVRIGTSNTGPIVAYFDEDERVAQILIIEDYALHYIRIED